VTPPNTPSRYRDHRDSGAPTAATPGVDLPYDFEGVRRQSPRRIDRRGFGVRHVAKEESPLAQLVTNENVIYSVADVTFYGKDLVGNVVTASGSLSVNFGNFADQ
jgi:hypothetical protein